VTSDLDFKVTTFCDVEYQKKTARFKDKVTFAQEESVPNIVEWYYVCWPRLVSKRVACVCQH